MYILLSLVVSVGFNIALVYSLLWVRRQLKLKEG